MKKEEKVQEDKNVIETVLKPIEGEIAKKVNIVSLGKVSRNMKNDIFLSNNDSSFGKSTSINKTKIKINPQKGKEGKRNFINTSTNYDSSIDEKNYSHIEKSEYLHTDSNNVPNVKMRVHKFLVKK